MSNKRRDRSDMRVDTFERKHGLQPGSIRNPRTGRDIRGDCRLGTLREREQERTR